MIGDVGESAFEELDILPHAHDAVAPVNYGWPCYEGDGRTDVPWERCAQLWADPTAEVVSPAYTYRHQNGASVTGGVFYTGEVYPPDYRDSYFFGDYAQDFIRTARVDDAGTVGNVEGFAPAGVAGGPVDFLQGPDDRIWYLSIYDGSIRVINYTAPSAVSSCAVGTFSRTIHDLSDSSLATDPADYESGWSWLRFSNASLPVETMAPARCVSTIGVSGADDDLPDADRYAVRWQGRVRVDGGTYEFAASGRDWVRLWVDDELRFEWFASPFFGQLRSAVKLPAGIHAVRFEVVHDTGPIEAALDWAQTGTLPQVDLTAPQNGVVLPTVSVSGERHGSVDYSAVVTRGDADLRRVTVTADLLHVTGSGQHAHPSRSATYDVTGESATVSGRFEVDDSHARGNSVFRLRAKVEDESGASRWSAPTYVCLSGNLVGICGSS